MPRSNTSNNVKKRVGNLLRALLTYANQEIANNNYFEDEVTIKWQDENIGSYRLLVKTKLKYLVELVFPGQATKKNKEYLRHDLRILRDFIGILEDNRIKKQGSDEWFFVLRLWHRSIEKNLREFEAEWQQRKSKGSKKNNLSEQEDSGNVEPSLMNLSLSTPITSPQQTPTQPRPFNNLPARRTAFIGLKVSLTRLLKLLSAHHSTTIISVEGIGGIGKTTLVLEAACRCLEAASAPEAYPSIPNFGAIIFNSAQTKKIRGPNISGRLNPERNLEDIIRTIFRTLRCLDQIPGDFDTRLHRARELLQEQPTLLIIDNLEAIEDQDLVFSFIDELPATVKVLLTSRTRLGLGSTISLERLPQKEGLELIQHKALEKELQLSATQCQSIYERTGGHPLAITYTIGQIAVYGLDPSLATTHLTKPTGNFSRYCFEDSVQRFRGQVAHKLLLALTLFPQSASQEALADIAVPKASRAAIKKGLGKLYELSLLRKEGMRFTMHPLTSEYVSTELDDSSRLRHRWVKWYRKFLAPYKKFDWQEWQDYDFLQQEWFNLREVMEWCQAQNHYEDVQELWKSLKGCTLFSGYWYDRLAWLNWLIKIAQEKQDWPVVADATYHKAKTLAHLNQADPQGEAFTLGKKAWELCQSQDINLQLEITAYLAALLGKKGEFAEGKKWLNKGYNLLSQISPTEDTYIYQEIQFLYCEGQLHQSNNDYKKSQGCYQKALKKAQAIKWQRMIAYIQGGIAYILLEQGNLPEAKDLFGKILKQARNYQDRRCAAFCENYLANIEKQQNNLSDSRHWAESAQQSFANLNMAKEAEEIATLLKE